MNRLLEAFASTAYRISSETWGGGLDVPGLARLDERRYGDTLIRRLVPADPGGRGDSTGGLGSG